MGTHWMANHHEWELIGWRIMGTHWMANHHEWGLIGWRIITNGNSLDGESPRIGTHWMANHHEWELIGWRIITNGDSLDDTSSRMAIKSAIFDNTQSYLFTEYDAILFPHQALQATPFQS
jgi:hypothetical protein